MSDPRWRDTRPSSPYGGEPGGRPPRRDPRGSDPGRRGGPRDDDATRRTPAQTQPPVPPTTGPRPAVTQPVAPRPVVPPAVLPPAVLPSPVVPSPVAPRPGVPQPLFVPRDGTGPSGAGRAGSGAGRTGSGAGRAGSGAGRAHGRRADSRRRGSSGRLSRIWQGSLRGSLGVCVIAGSAVIGAVATIATHVQPGSVLALAVLAGTVAAALTVQPRTGRLIFPVPALSYLIAALVAGVAYERSSDKTELA